MAKEQAPRRSLTPEEIARRKATMAGGAVAQQAAAQPVEYDTAVENYSTRLAVAAKAVSPMAVDYDRDGYPDSVVGRSSRNFRQRARHANAETPDSVAAATAASVSSQRGGSFGGTYSIGNDGYRQDQVGYRDRLRGRVEAVRQLTEAAEAGEDDADAKGIAARQMGVQSHGSTGVPGGLPPAREGTPGVPVPTGTKPGLTAVEQAIISPRTQGTGFENKGAQKVTNVVPMPLGSGIPGPEGTLRRGSYGSVPVQGTQQPDGSFTVGSTLPVSVPAGKEHAKPAEHKPAEHTKPPEHARPAEHKPAEHTKHPEPHKK